MLRDYVGPVYDVDLDEPPETRWKAFCRKEGHNVKNILDDVHQAIEENLLGELSSPLRTLVKGFGSGVGWFVHAVANMYGEEYTAELRGIAKHADVPSGDLMLGNLIYDLTSLSEMYGCGCSSASFDLDDTPVLVRNMDWVSPRSTGKHTRLIRFHRGGSSYTSVGVVGCVGVASAFCPGQWAVTLNQAPIVKQVSWLNASCLFRWPALQHMRAVCDRMPDYHSMVIGLRAQQTMVPFFAHVVGKEKQQHSVVVHTGEETFLRSGHKHRAKLVQTNHYTGNRLKEHNPENGDDYVWDTYTRYDTLKSRLEKSVVKTPADALRLLKGPDVASTDTMQQMLLWPAREKMVLKIQNG